MNVKLESGKYVVAVSGGVDSVVLLDMLARHNPKEADYQLIVAHFDHGIRPGSAADRQFVQTLAEKYQLPFEYAEGELGEQASEETARAARYLFLKDVQQKHSAHGIITAHHQDDVLETAILNLLRGTGRKGLTSLGSSSDIIRPLLNSSKQEILAYAKNNNLKWHEDSTNQNPKYLRNYIRLYLLPRLKETEKQRLLDIINQCRTVNSQLDKIIAELYLTTGTQLERTAIIALPHAVALEVMAAWLRDNDLREFDRYTLERLVVAAKTGRPDTRANIYGKHIMCITKAHLALTSFER